MTNQYLEELGQKQGVDYRANVPAGTLLGEEELAPGATAKFTKRRSMMRAGAKTLPERQALYDLRRHDLSMVPPTIAMKRMSDYPGRFTTIEPAGWHDNDPVPIDEICQVCAANPEYVNVPRHYSRAQLILHYQLVHTIEWQGIEADRREQDQREDRAQMRALIASIAAVNRAGVELPPEVVAELDEYGVQDATPERPRGPGRPRKAGT